MLLKCKGSLGKNPTIFSKAFRDTDFWDCSICRASLHWGGQGRRVRLKAPIPPSPFSPQTLASTDTRHSSVPSPSPSSPNALYKYCYFLVTHCAICAGYTILFTFKLPLLYNSLDIFMFTSKSNPLGAEQHTGKLWRAS